MSEEKEKFLIQEKEIAFLTLYGERFLLLKGIVSVRRKTIFNHKIFNH